MADSDVAVQRADMQAVIVIHGMGEQAPMDTIKGFVNAVWQKDDVVTATGLPNSTEVWSKPDARTGSLELRRITTREIIASPPTFPQGARTDFLRALLGGPYRWRDLELVKGMGPAACSSGRSIAFRGASGLRGCYCGFCV